MTQEISFVFEEPGVCFTVNSDTGTKSVLILSKVQYFSLKNYYKGLDKKIFCWSELDFFCHLLCNLPLSLAVQCSGLYIMFTTG